MPNIPGIGLPGVYALRNPSDADAILAAVEAGLKRAVIVGGRSHRRGDGGKPLQPRRAREHHRHGAAHPAGFDADFADYVENLLADNGIPVFLGDGVTEIEGTDKVTKLRTSKRAIKTDAVIMAVGVRPNTEWLAARDRAGEERCHRGGRLHAHDLEDVYAAGDVVMVKTA